MAVAVGVLAEVQHPLKVQVDLKELAPLSEEVAGILLRAIAPMRASPHLGVVVGCMGDWNLRTLRRLDRDLTLGLDFAYYLDAPVDGLIRWPSRINVYGYLDDHPLGYRRLLPTQAYLEDRMEVLLDLVPGAGEFYLRKEFLLQTLADGVNPIRFIHERKPGALVDVWTLYTEEPDLKRTLLAALDAGADQITSPTCARLAEVLAGC